jgi:hypothetical protein
MIVRSEDFEVHPPKWMDAPTVSPELGQPGMAEFLETKLP